ncbi:Dehydrogenase aclE [Psilocybe cubensis]|uniref:Dehydrogenase aclE n=2 Tax=Psilocybe cubensis TaxID=181762 RepID=A0ACB8GP26_PSICU|nr:Dehydrogenase aclE [Psilocybe cubensis]KAH9477117.1 Dehydrogenase aclE [Psilocybe cubensis]
MVEYSNQKTNVGFIGLSATSGWAATALAPALIQPSLRDKYDLVAVSTTTEASSLASADKYSKEVGHHIKSYFGPASRIASDEDVNLVAISVKAPHHKEVVLSAIEAKKDFFVEWPAGISTKETEEIASSAREHGVRSLVGLQGRHSVVVRKVKEILSSGVVGTVRSTNVIAHLPREAGTFPPFTFDYYEYTLDKNNGATMLTVPIGHQLDTLTHVLGDFVKVSAIATNVYPVLTVLDRTHKPTGKTVAYHQPDHYAISGVLKSGILANILWRTGYASTEGRRQYVWEIEGEEGTIRMESNNLLGAMASMIEPDLYLNGKKVDFETSGNAVESCVEAWMPFSNGPGGDYATIEDAVKHHRLLDAIEASVQEGKVVAL